MLLSKDAMFSKEAHIRQWVTRQLGSVEHERRVARAAKLLFGLTRSWHNLPLAEARLLTLGAWVHDVGRAIDDKGHARHGAGMILQNKRLPISDSERRRLAYLTRYHRGRVPELGEEEILQRADVPFASRILLGLLRAADTLDSRSLGAPRLVFDIRERTLLIHGYCDLDNPADIFARPKKLQLLEEMLDCQIRTRWFASRQPALIA